MNEKILKDAIKSRLEESFPTYGTMDFPINIFDYFPSHPKGELLIKMMGFRPQKYIDRGNKLDVLDLGSYVILYYQWRIELIVREIITQDEMLTITQEIVESMITIENIENGVGKVFIMDIGEPGYDVEKMFQFRTMVFFVPVLLYVGG